MFKHLLDVQSFLDVQSDVWTSTKSDSLDVRPFIKGEVHQRVRPGVRQLGRSAGRPAGRPAGRQGGARIVRGGKKKRGGSRGRQPPG